MIVVLLPATGPVELTVTTCRSGQPFLLLHGGAGPHPVTGSGELLATAHQVCVLVPVHPGFGGTHRPDGLARHSGTRGTPQRPDRAARTAGRDGDRQLDRWPWQLFFQQSNVVDKRITTRFLGYERADTALGTVLFAAGALGVLLACGFAFGPAGAHGAFTDAAAVARGLRTRAGGAAGALFAVVLVAGSVLGASEVTLATSYAVGDYFGLRHSLHRRWREARTFHRTYAACMLAAAAVVLIPQVPLGLLTTAVQALAGILLPSATVFLLLLCNDREVLGPLVNPRWLNVLAAAVIGALLGLSALLTATTVVPRMPLAPAVTGLAVTITVLAACAALLAIRARPAPAPAPGTDDRRTWTMPPIESLRPPARSAWRTLGLVVLRCYLLATIVVLAVRAIQIALGAGQNAVPEP